MKTIIIPLICTALLLMAGTARAEKNFSTLPTGELAALKGTLQNASQEERAAFIKEWQKRVEAMTPEQRQQYTGAAKEGGDGSLEGAGASGGAQPNCQ